MKQILQNLSNGDTILVDVPCPSVSKGSLLIASKKSLVSAGTEKMLVDFGKANLLDKVRQQPDKVKMVLDKVKTDGLITTIDAVRSKLDQPIPLGYCNVGIILESGVNNFFIGERVASNGNHASRKLNNGKFHIGPASNDVEWLYEFHYDAEHHKEIHIIRGRFGTWRNHANTPKSRMSHLMRNLSLNSTSTSNDGEFDMFLEEWVSRVSMFYDDSRTSNGLRGTSNGLRKPRMVSGNLGWSPGPRMIWNLPASNDAECSQI